jgi:hypothetical protein
MDKVKKFMQLSQREKWLFLQVAFWLIAAKIGLYLLPFERLRRWMAHFGEPRAEHMSHKEMGAIIQAIERIARFLTPFGINCLPQALVGHMLLRRKGFDVQLKIGVRKEPCDKLIAHAWLEYEGQVIMGDLGNLRQFTALPPLDLVP